MKNRMVGICSSILMAGSLIAATAASAGVDGENIHDLMLNGSKSASPPTEQQAAPVRADPQEKAGARQFDRRLKALGEGESPVALVPERGLCLGTHLSRISGGC